MEESDAKCPIYLNFHIKISKFWYYLKHAWYFTNNSSIRTPTDYFLECYNLLSHVTKKKNCPCWYKENLYSLLEGMQTRPAFLENNMNTPQKKNWNWSSLWSSNSTFLYIPQVQKHNAKNLLYIHCSTMHNRQITRNNSSTKL